MHLVLAWKRAARAWTCKSSLAVGGLRRIRAAQAADPRCHSAAGGDGQRVTELPDPLDDEVQIMRFVDWPEMTPEQLDVYIGTPPGWYYALVGRIATVMGGIEQDMVELAYEFVQPQYNYYEVLEQLESAATMKALFKRVGDGRFAVLLGRFWEARQRRDALVHVFVAWHDYEGPDEPAGWHFVNPRLAFAEHAEFQQWLQARRSGRKTDRRSPLMSKARRGTAYLDTQQTRARMDEDFEFMLKLRADIYDLYNEMQQS